MPRAVSISMFTPWHAHCGIADYSFHLITALGALPDHPRVHVVEALPDGVLRTTKEALLSRASRTRKLRQLGSLLNTDRNGAHFDIAHIQHQYFLFGGVAPHKNTFPALLDAVRVPLVVTAHEVVQADAQRSAAARLAVRVTNHANFRHPSIRRIMVHTEQDRCALVQSGVSVERVHTITHGVPAAQPMPSAAEAKQALDLEGRSVVTLFGFLASKKGHFAAIEALATLADDVTLLFAGGPHPDDRTGYADELRTRIDCPELRTRVRITGYLEPDNVPIVMAATDVAIAPYAQTSGSGALANLLAYGRAVVASDIMPFREIASEQPACLELFRSGDAGDLSRTVARVLASPARRAALSEAALAYSRRHSYGEMAARTLEVYRDVLADVSP